MNWLLFLFSVAFVLATAYSTFMWERGKTGEAMYYGVLALVYAAFIGWEVTRIT